MTVRIDGVRMIRRNYKEKCKNQLIMTEAVENYEVKKKKKLAIDIISIFQIFR